MKKLVGRFAALCAFFAVALTLSACGSGVPGNSVADVAGNPITVQAFNHWLYVAAKSQAAQNPGSPVIVPDPPGFTRCIAQIRSQIPQLAKLSAKTLRFDCKQAFGSYSQQVMQFLIQGYWFQLEANRQHVKVTNAQVQKALQKAAGQRFSSPGQFQSFLSQTGQTRQDILFRFRIIQISTKLLAKETPKITPSAIQQYYNAHRTQFGRPETRNIRIVLTKSAAQAQAAKRALASGQSWNKVAKKYSIDPTTKNSGGALIGVTKGQEDAALDSAAFSAPSGKLLGPVKGQFGYYVFEVTKIVTATQQSVAQATGLIRQTLVGQQQTSAQKALTKLLMHHWQGQTSCRSGYMVSYCSGYKPPKHSTSTTG